MKTLRTPDERFTGLPGFDFAPNYVEIADSEGGTLRVHYLREGDPDAPVVLLMHGEPSWSYLYRKMIPVLVDAGLQVVAPTWSGSAAPTSPPNAPTTPLPATSNGCASCSSTASTCAG